MPASTKVDLANIALRRIGEKKPIAHLSEQPVLALLWDHALGVAIEQHDWTFARRTVALVLDSEAPTTEWAFSYLVPADCLVPRMITDGLQQRREEDVIPFVAALNALEVRVLYTDMQDAILRYSRLVSNETLWTFSFADYFAWVLASEVALALSLSDEIRARAYNGREWSFGRAWDTDRRSERHPAPLDAEWHEARRG